MGANITVAVSVIALALGIITAYKTWKSESKKADAAMLDTLAEALNTEIKRCNQDCNALRTENQQLRADLSEAERRAYEADRLTIQLKYELDQLKMQMKGTTND